MNASKIQKTHLVGLRLSQGSEVATNGAREKASPKRKHPKSEPQAGRMVEESRDASHFPLEATADTSSKLNPLHSLSSRQVEILAHASADRGDKQIAEQLGISHATVRHHWKFIHLRLGTKTRAGACVKFAHRLHYQNGVTQSDQ